MSPALLLLPDFALILFGYLLHRRRFLPEAFWGGAEKFIYFILFPPLLFRALARAELDFVASLPMLAVGVAFTLAGFGLGYLARWLFALPQPSFAAGLQSAYRFNSYVGFAVIGTLAGRPGIAAIALLFGLLIPLVNVLAVWQLARAGGGRIGRELLRNPLIWGIAAGLSCNVLGVPVPDWLFHTVAQLADAALPLGLIAVGAGLRFGPARHYLGVLGYWSAVKLLALPLLAFWFGRWAGLSGVYQQAALVMSALPTATSTYILAVRMGGDGKLAAALVTTSTLAAMLTLPLVLTLLT